MLESFWNKISKFVNSFHVYFCLSAKVGDQVSRDLSSSLTDVIKSGTIYSDRLAIPGWETQKRDFLCDCNQPQPGRISRWWNYNVIVVLARGRSTRLQHQKVIGLVRFLRLHRSHDYKTNDFVIIVDFLDSFRLGDTWIPCSSLFLAEEKNNSLDYMGGDEP